MELPRFKLKTHAGAKTPDEQHSDWEFECFQLLLSEARANAIQLAANAAHLVAIQATLAIILKKLTVVGISVEPGTPVERGK